MSFPFPVSGCGFEVGGSPDRNVSEPPVERRVGFGERGCAFGKTGGFGGDSYVPDRSSRVINYSNQ